MTPQAALTITIYDYLPPFLMHWLSENKSSVELVFVKIPMGKGSPFKALKAILTSAFLVVNVQSFVDGENTFPSTSDIYCLYLGSKEYAKESDDGASLILTENDDEGHYFLTIRRLDFAGTTLITCGRLTSTTLWRLLLEFVNNPSQATTVSAQFFRLSIPAVDWRKDLLFKIGQANKYGS